MAVPVLSQIKNAINYIVGGFRTTNYQTRVWGVGSQEVYAPIEQENAITKGYNNNAAVYSITKKYAKKAASINRYLENKQTEEPYENHPLMELLNRPNEKQSHYALFKTVYTFYKICGEAFIWLNRGDVTQMVGTNGELQDRTPDQYMKQPIIEMHCIPANQMVIIPDNDDPFNVVGYQLRNNPAIKFRKEDIIHWKDVNLEWDELGKPQLRGMSPLKPGSRTLTADWSATDSMVRMFQNDGAKGIAFEKLTGAKKTPQQETQVRNVFDVKVNNKEVKNAVAALEGDWGYLDLGKTAVDLETLAGREFIYKELCFLLDVPYGFFDSHTPYAEKQLAARDWISNSIKPDVQELDGELQLALFAAFNLNDKTAKLCSNFDELPELQEDKGKQVEWLMKLWPLTPNQVLEELGYERNADTTFDEPWVPGGVTPLSQTLIQDESQNILSDIQAQQLAAGVNGKTNRANGNGKVPAY